MGEDGLTITGIIAFVVLTASFVVACGVVGRAIRSLWRAFHRLEARLQKLHELSEPEEPEED